MEMQKHVRSLIAGLKEEEREKKMHLVGLEKRCISSPPNPPFPRHGSGVVMVVVAVILLVPLLLLLQLWTLIVISIVAMGIAPGSRPALVNCGNAS